MESSACEPLEETLLTLPLLAPLQVKAGTAKAHLGDKAGALEAFEAVLQYPVDSYADLYTDCGDVLLSMGEPDKALPFFTCAALCYAVCACA